MVPFILGRRSVLRLGAGALAATTGPFRMAGAATPEAITIANASGNMNLVMQELMRQVKFLEGFDLAPKIIHISDGTKILAGIVSGEVDCSTMSGFGQVFPAVAKGAQLKVLAGGALPPTLAVFSAKPEIRSVADIAGKTCGVGSLGALLHQLMVALLAKKRVKIDSVRFVNVGSSADVFRAVAAGVVDAGPGEIAFLDDPERYHVHGLSDGNMSEQLPEFTYQGAWASDHALQARRSVLVRCLAAYAKLYRFVQTPAAHDAFIAAAATVLKTSGESAWEGLWNYIQKYKPFAVDLVLSKQRIDYLQDLNIQVKVQSEMLPFERVADMSLAEEALKLL